MAGGEMRANRLMWFAAGAVTMAMYLQGPHAIWDNAYQLAESAAFWLAATI